MASGTSVAADADVLTGKATLSGGSGEKPQTQTLISSLQSRSPVDARELWRYRELLYFLIWRDVKIRYKQTVLGAAWAVLQPAMMMVVFTVFFGRMAKVSSGDLPYPLFVYAGLLPWTFFAASISSAANSVVGSERLITKIYFPRLLIPIAAIGAALLDLVVASVGLVVLMVYFGVGLQPQLMLIPLVVLLLTMAGLGVGTLLSALNVAYRDFRHVIPFMVQLWLFATPSVYMEPHTGATALASSSANPVLSPAGGYPGHGLFEVFATIAHYALAANPMTGLIGSFRAAALGLPMEWGRFGMSAAAAMIILIVAVAYFRRVEDTFADVI